MDPPAAIVCNFNTKRRKKGLNKDKAIDRRYPISVAIPYHSRIHPVKVGYLSKKQFLPAIKKRGFIAAIFV